VRDVLEMCSQVFVGEPVRQETEDDEDAQERLHARIAETQRRTPLTIADHRCTDFFEGRFSDVAVRARSLDVE